ncbi:hypothetical protein D8M30_17075, partial [Corynebacterium pseudodiphtheriticum]
MPRRTGMLIMSTRQPEGRISAMLEPGQRTPTPILRQMVGWVLVLPLLVAWVKLPFPLGMLLSLGSIAASAYGVWRARRYASRRVTRLAWVVIVLNVSSWVLTANASVDRKSTR